MIIAELNQFIQRIPKAELHCHLEGAVEPATLLELAARHGLEVPFADEAGARKFYEFTDLTEFLNIFSVIVRTLQTARDFETIAVALGADSVRQNIPYREVMFTYAYHDRRGVPWQEVADGLASGRAIVEERHGVEMRFIADIERTVDPEIAIDLVKKAHASHEAAGIVAIGMDGQEVGYPAGRHERAFQLAGELGFRRVAHSGEVDGPQSVWHTLEALGVDRIDHGNRSIEDARLIDHLVKRQIPLTVCPISNVAIKAYPDLASHTVKQLIDAGVLVTLNSDDPAMFNADLVSNFVQVADTFNLTVDQVEQLARNSFTAAFLDAETKAGYLDRFDKEVSALRQELF